MHLEHTQFVADRERYAREAATLDTASLLTRHASLVFEISDCPEWAIGSNLNNDQWRQLDAIVDELSNRSIHV